MYYIYLFIFFPLALLPLPVLYWISDLLYIIIYKVGKYRLPIVQTNLRNSFPGKSERELQEIEKGYYHHLCDLIVETLKLLHISDKEVRRRVEVNGAELVEKIADEGKPVMVMLGHYGNWEYVPSVTLHYEKPQKSGQIYRPIKDKAFDRLMLKIRSRFGSESIPQKRTLRRMVEMRKEYGTFLIGFIADQHPNSEVWKHWTTFLGQPTAYVTGAEDIGQKFGAGYLYLDVEKPSRGRYRLTFREMHPEDDGQPYPYTRLYMQMMEQTIRRQPMYWLWSHRRWLNNNNTK